MNTSRISALLTAVALLLVGHGLQFTLLPVYASQAGFAASTVAMIGAAYFAGFVSGCLVTPWLLLRVGHIRVFAILATIASTVVLAHFLLPEPGWWLLLRFITGVCLSGLYATIESWLNETSSTENRGRVLSIYTVVTLVFMTIGQLAMNLADVAGATLFALAAVMLSLAIVPVAFSVAPAPSPPARPKFIPVRLWHISHVAFLGSIASGMITGSFWSLGPVFAERSGLDIQGVSLFMSATIIGGAALQVPIGLASDKMDRRKVIAVITSGIALASLLMTLVPPGLIWLLLTTFVFGGFSLTLYAVCVAHANDNVDPEEFVQTGTAILLFYGIGAVIGPLLAGPLMTWLGPHGVYVFTLAAAVAATGVVLVRIVQHRGQVPRTRFRGIAETTSPVAFSMDPRGEEPPADDDGDDYPLQKAGAT